MLRKIGAALILLSSLTIPLNAKPAPHLPPETRNAALRYWMAFAEIQDPPSDKETTDLLEKTAAGEAAWDDAKLGSILVKNETAIQIMQRAAKLPECDWGLEYSRGPEASIAYAPRARVLARLNTLYGMRLATMGDTREAVDTWLAGIRFSEDLAKGGTLIFALIAKAGFLSNVNALFQAAEKGILSPQDKAKVAATLRALPESAFDWSQALSYEQSGIEIAVKNVESASNPGESYQRLMGTPPPNRLSALSASDAAAFAKVMAAAEEAMRKKPEETEQRLESLRKDVALLNPVYQQMMPSFTKVNDSRRQIQAARQKLLALVSGK